MKVELKLTKEYYKHIWNCHNEAPHTTNMYAKLKCFEKTRERINFVF
jgi:hypothetical protein